ncbi:MAG: gfo/Idh/MocA family oxidoreductase [Bacteroidetes bacterium]|nr:MAG: gfo/Idh/MocA family oxidoreductase [Bacteroidota bacterium]
MTSRRNFLRTAALGGAGLALSARSYGRILGANDRVRVGIAGFSDRAKASLIPPLMAFAKEMNFEVVAVSDIWNRRRAEAAQHFEEVYGQKVNVFRNHEEMYDRGKVDAVIVSTADFQHALHCIEAVEARCDVYVEKPLAETMEDNRRVREVVGRSEQIVQVGTQRRSAPNYQAANEYIRSGKFGKINMVEMCWNVNQPGRWRRPHLVEGLRETDIDWSRFLLNRPYEAFDPRKYVEYRLFWPYSSGIPSQWMSHQIDTVHWFSGYDNPRSVTANGGIYMWTDGRTNADTMTAVFDYGPEGDAEGDAFQVLYTSRMHNSAGDVKEIYFSNGGSLNLDTNQINSAGGLSQEHAAAMNMSAFLLENATLESAGKIITAANTGSDPMTTAHMRNWMDCVRSRKQPNAPVEVGYNHSVANIMTRTALQTGKRVTFDKEKQEVVAS